MAAIVKGAGHSALFQTTIAAYLRCKHVQRRQIPTKCLCFGTLVAAADAPTEQPRAQLCLRNGRLISVSHVPSSADVSNVSGSRRYT